MKFLIPIILLPTCVFSQSLDTLDFGKGYFIVGVMENNEINGKGYKFLKWEKVYEGEFLNSEYQGFGKYYIDGALYLEGIWKNGRFKEGKRYIGNGRVDTGLFDQYEMLSGSIAYGDGSRYEGKIQKNNRHGAGTLFLSDGTGIEATWKNGKPVGNAIVYYPDGKTINGRWKRTKLNEIVLLVSTKGGLEEPAKNSRGELLSMSKQ